MTWISHLKVFKPGRF